MKKILLTWIGTRDLKKSLNFGNNAASPVAELLKNEDYNFNEAHILQGYSKTTVVSKKESNFINSCQDKSFYNNLEKISQKEKEKEWSKGSELINSILEKKIACKLVKDSIEKEVIKTDVIYHTEKYNDQDDTKGIYKIVETLLAKLQKENPKAEFTFFTSPGTSAMQFIWGSVASLHSNENIKLLAYSNSTSGYAELAIPFKLKIEEISKQNKKEQTSLMRQYYKDIDYSILTENFIANSAEMEQCLAEAAMFANYEYPVLLLGETGVGKTTIAEKIHKASKKEGAFISVNCSALPDNMIESELFGYKKGGFTGAIKDKDGAFKRADKGTLFLDEIGEINQDIQVKLLTALQGKFTPIGGVVEEKCYVRIITATNRNLNQEVANGNFRMDLFYRLAVNIINIPPMRDRKDDLKESINLIINETNKKCAIVANWKEKKINDDAFEYLIENRELKGNFRELENILRSAMKFPSKQTIDLNDVEKAIKNIHIPEKENNNSNTNWLFAKLANEKFNFKKESEEIKKKIARELYSNAKNKTRLAELLNITNKESIAKLLKITRPTLDSNL